MAVQTMQGSYRSPLFIDAIRTINRKGMLDFFYDIWRKHGDLTRVQIGNMVSYLAVHPDHVHHINVAAERRANYDKAASYDAVRRLMLGNGLVTSVGDVWKRQRRLLSPFFTPRGIEQYIPIFISEAEKLRVRWEKFAAQGEPIEMITEMMRLTSIIILRTLFSTTSDEEVHSTAHDVDFLIAFTSNFLLKPLRAPLWVPTKQNTEYHQVRARINTYINSLIAKRRAMPVDEYPNDMLSKLMLARDEETGEGMSDELIRDEAVTMFFAGHETTARALAFTWYALAGEPEVSAKLHAEIDSTIGTATPTVEALKRMPYTLQTVKETLRLYPSAPMYVRDVVTDDVLDGITIKRGTRMMLMPYCTHRHPDFWDEPERYNPDRFAPEQEAARHPYAFHPFATGQRICAGNNFALLEMHILLGMLAAQFAPRRKAGHQPQLEMAGTLGSRNGIWMHIEQR